MLESLRQIWERLGLGQRALLVLILAACIGASALLVGWARKPHMALLYSGLEPGEAAKVTEKIQDAGVPYELKDGGTTIYADSKKIYSLRLSMAASGLPAGQNRGYQLLDETNIGISSFKERVNFTRAIEGELAKTIQLIEGVNLAKVHLVRPESRAFSSKQKTASATVVLGLKPGWRLSPSKVAAIIHLVAGGVEGLAPGGVVVVDSSGRLLTREGDNEFAGAAGSYLDYKGRVETYMAGKVEDLLVAALGPNRVSVRVDAEIDMSNVSETIEKYAPKGVLTKEDTSTPVAMGGGKDKSGDGDGKATSGGVTVGNKKELTEYKLSRTVSTTTELPGKIKSLTVAAFVDLSPPPVPEVAEGEEPPPPQKMPSLEDIEALIRNAIGIKAADKATLKVVETTFPQPAEAALASTLPQDDGGMMSPAFLLQMARQASLGILVLGALLMLKIFSGAKKKAILARQGQAGLESGDGAGRLLLPTEIAEIDPKQLRSHISHALQENPDAVKRLFQRWVESEKGTA